MAPAQVPSVETLALAEVAAALVELAALVEAALVVVTAALEADEEPHVPKPD